MRLVSLDGLGLEQALSPRQLLGIVARTLEADQGVTELTVRQTLAEKVLHIGELRGEGVDSGAHHHIDEER